MRFSRAGARWRAAFRRERTYVSLERAMKCGIGHCGHCQLGPTLVCRDGPVYALERASRLARGAGAVSASRRSPSGSSPRATAASSACSTARTSCSRSPTAVEIGYFLEASSATVAGPYDVSLVEGSITTPHDAERIREIREASTTLIAIGACATAGGIQALRNFADIEGFLAAVYATPGVHLDARHLDADRRTTCSVDLELQGCPINKHQLLEVDLARSSPGARPNIPAYSVCVECKRRGTPCVMVARGVPCLGPVTHAGCGAICPAYARGCYGCFGPKETPNAAVAARLVDRPARPRRADASSARFATFNVESVPVE